MSNHLRVLGRDLRSPQHDTPIVLAEQSDPLRHPPHLKRVRSHHVVGDVLLHISVHPLDDRDDGDEKGDADDDPEQREKRAEFVRSNLPECREKNVCEKHGCVERCALRAKKEAR